MIILRYFFRLFFKLLYGFTIDKKNLLELKDKKLIVVANHTSSLDPLILGASLNRKPIFLAKKELLDGHLGWLFKRFNLIRVDRDHPGNVIDQAVERLNSGGLIVLFPEGTRHNKKPHQLLPFKFGAVKMAQLTSAPIIPCAITENPKLCRRRKNKIIFGKPLYVKKTDAITAKNNQLRQSVADLLMNIEGVNIKLVGSVPAKNPSKSAPR